VPQPQLELEQGLQELVQLPILLELELELQQVRPELALLLRLVQQQGRFELQLLGQRLLELKQQMQHPHH
jgi:hypothetical protein